MPLSLIQIILSILAIFMLWSSLGKFLRQERSQTLFKLLASVLIWGSILTFSIFPALSHTITHYLGFGDNLNTLIFFGFIVIFLILTKIISAIERIESSISEIVRKEALSKMQRK